MKGWLILAVPVIGGIVVGLFLASMAEHPAHKLLMFLIGAAVGAPLSFAFIPEPVTSRRPDGVDSSAEDTSR